MGPSYNTKVENLTIYFVIKKYYIMDEKISKKVVYSVIKKLNEFYNEIFEGVTEEKIELKPEDFYIPKDFAEYEKIWKSLGVSTSPNKVKGFYIGNWRSDNPYRGKIILNPRYIEKIAREIDESYEELKKYDFWRPKIREFHEKIAYLASLMAHEATHKKDIEELQPEYQKLWRIKAKPNPTKEEMEYYYNKIKELGGFTRDALPRIANEGKAFFIGTLYSQDYRNPFSDKSEFSEPLKNDINELLNTLHENWYNLSVNPDPYTIAKFIGMFAGFYLIKKPPEERKRITKEILAEKDMIKLISRLSYFAEKGLKVAEEYGFKKFVYSNLEERDIERIESLMKSMLEFIRKYYGIAFGFLGIALLPFLLSSKTFTGNFSLVNITTFLLFNVFVLLMFIGISKIIFQER